RPLPLWQTELYNDRRWNPAQEFGPLETSEPRRVAAANDTEEIPVIEQVREESRFEVADEFRVEMLLDDAVTGSVIAMAFNEFGQLILSQEGGPLVIANRSESGDGFDTPRLYCELVSSCQGLLPLNGDVYVTGQGPEGVGLYRLSDADRDGVLEQATRLLAFRGGLGEHGPHGITLGADGMIYCVVGNFSRADVDYAATSPVQNVYEGDLLTTKLEDPSGHATGVKAPGGTVIRCSLDGSEVELVASGLRNCYDVAFNSQGELFTYDSDMESDIGMSWYRPTRVLHVVPGAEFGWRSGWSKWPDYYLDSLPPLTETDRGSPTGIVAYDHFMFPTKYHGALFLGDWSEGRILAVTLRPSGAGYSASTEVFLQGQPLNVTDLDVGPDGSLYFATGGRATSGGIYRVTWNGSVPDSVRDIPDDLTGVIRQPQLQSAWARQRVAKLRVELSEEWSQTIRGVVLATENPAHYRTRALDLLQLYGPKPDVALLSLLLDDEEAAVRAKAAELLGLNAGERGLEPLTELLGDEDRLVRRKAAEALLRAELLPSFENLKRMLISDDRYESWAARRLLERFDPATYHDEMLSTDNHRLFIQCATAMLIAHPTKTHSYETLARVAELIQGFVSDRNFIDMLRVVQLAMERGEVEPELIPAFAEMMADEFPSGNSIMNRELSRILAYMKSTQVGDRLATYLRTPAGSPVDKIHVAMMFQTIHEGWSTEQRLALIDYLEDARMDEGGGSYAYYIMEAAKELGRTASDEERALILAKGDQWPNAAVGVFYRLPETLDARTIRAIEAIDEKIVGTDPEDDSYTQLKIGIVAVLGRSGDNASMAYLRRIWDRDEERRGTVALGLAQTPSGENWSYLVNSLDLLEDDVAREVLVKLVNVERRPNTPDQFRQVIMLGLKLKDQGAEDAIRLLEHWTGEHLSLEGDPWDSSLESWQRWFARQ
ncbi:MAG: HEAT repeat domain-containing protein, partial [Planctomycetales bacterium]|nr:HEAT repeat domain-containing protein [Planctomycetales bacterium]